MVGQIIAAQKLTCAAGAMAALDLGPIASAVPSHIMTAFPDWI